jgi:hypothetical protein
VAKRQSRSIRRPSSGTSFVYAQNVSITFSDRGFAVEMAATSDKVDASTDTSISNSCPKNKEVPVY